jgi:hypothetical protein
MEPGAGRRVPFGAASEVTPKFIAPSDPISRRRHARLVTGEAEVTKVDRRQIEFTVRATEGAKEIRLGSHSRVIIDVPKFTRRLG